MEKSEITPKPKIFIAVLHWNNAKDTIECISSLRLLRYPNFAVVIVDNGSTDGSLKILQTQFPECHFLLNQTNLGFAEGNNVALRYSLAQGASFVLLLNNDTTADPFLLDAFMEAASHCPAAAVFGAKIYFYDEPTTLWYAGGGVSKQGRCFHVGCGASDLDKLYETITPTSYACGCALLIRTNILEKVGYMNPDFFLLWEEIDWCFRIKKAGYECLFVPKAKVWHKISSSFEGGNRGPLWQYYYWRNRLLFIRAHHKTTGRIPFFLLFREMTQIFFLSLSPKNTSSRKKQRAALCGIIDFFMKNYGPCKRNAIK